MTMPILRKISRTRFTRCDFPAPVRPFTTAESGCLVNAEQQTRNSNSLFVSSPAIFLSRYSVLIWRKRLGSFGSTESDVSSSPPLDGPGSSGFRAGYADRSRSRVADRRGGGDRHFHGTRGR